MNLYIGLMSGTSMDGIDAALIDAENNQFISGITKPYETSLKQTLLNFNPEQKITPSELLTLNQAIGHAFAETALELLAQTNHSEADIKAIGSHGQTVMHAPDNNTPMTLQLGCPHTIAAATKMTVVADFRTRDMVLGGQGAPLAPYYHQELFKNKPLPLVVVNVGGISNLTILSEVSPTYGYDTGPGNVLLDMWARKHLDQPYDESGQWAKSGKVIEPLLDELLKDAYFQKRSPKSIDKQYFNAAWLHQYLKLEYKPEDVQATLAHLTAATIAQAILKDTPETKTVLISGGGAHNLLLLDALSGYLPNLSIQSTAAYDVHPDYLEAMMFAWFAHQTLSNKLLDFTQITGAKSPTLMGAIYPYAA